MASTETRPGTRVRVLNAKQTQELGWGVYLGEMLIDIEGLRNAPSVRIMLDSGKEVFGFECWWSEDPSLPPVAPFELEITKPVRTFTASGSLLSRSGYRLDQGDKVIVEEITPMIYDHRVQVAAKATIKGKQFYMIVTEIGLPTYYDQTEVNTPTSVH